MVPRERTAIYARGSFFKPIIPTSRVGSFRLLDVLHPTEELKEAGSEKGAAILNDDWDPASLFGMISALAPSCARQAPAEMSAILSSPEFVLCTDLGPEVADFVATQGSRVAFIHAKAASTARLCSASALHDVASQAIKNLPHLQPLADVGMQTGYWTRAWSAPPHVTGATRRLREGNLSSGHEMWRHIRKVVAAPDSEREVWLVLGQSLSKEALEKQVKPRPEAQAIQIFSLLQTTWAAVSQLGGRLRIFCSP